VSQYAKRECLGTLSSTERSLRAPARELGLTGHCREEVALLAGVSVRYYTRLERGDVCGATDTVLSAVSRAWLLDDSKRAHSFDLVRAANAATADAAAARTPRRTRRQPVGRNALASS
jgi:predicted transcriptional regulator